MRAILFVLAAVAQLFLAPILARAHAFESSLCAADHSGSGKSDADCQKLCGVCAMGGAVLLAPPSSADAAPGLHSISGASIVVAAARAVPAAARANPATGPPAVNT